MTVLLPLATAIPSAIGTWAWMRSRSQRHRSKRLAVTSACIGVYGSSPTQMLDSVKRAYARGAISFDQAAEMIDELLQRGA